MNPTYLLIQAGFALTTIIFYGALLKVFRSAVGKINRTESQKKKIFVTLVAGIFLWLLVTAALSLSGFLSDFSTVPPRLLITIIIPLLAIIILMNQKVTGEIVRLIPLHTLVYLQVFRVFVEILLWALYEQNLLPVQMTFEGRNFDVISGLTAPLIGVLLQRQKISNTVVIVWNFICLGILINIVVTALLSVPSPFRYFMNEPANTIVAEFPIVWLPALLVPLAYGLHFLSLKQLLQKK